MLLLSQPRASAWPGVCGAKRMCLLGACAHQPGRNPGTRDPGNSLSKEPGQSLSIGLFLRSFPYGLPPLCLPDLLSGPGCMGGGRVDLDVWSGMSTRMHAQGPS